MADFTNYSSYLTDAHSTNDSYFDDPPLIPGVLSLSFLHSLLKSN